MANRPKVIFKIDMNKDLSVQFTVVYLTDTYIDNSSSTNSKFHFTNNNWTVYLNKSFIVTKRCVLCLPKESKRQSTKLSFKTEDERYKFMKGFSTALLQWSKSNHLFKGDEHGKPKIQYYKQTWVVY